MSTLEEKQLKEIQNMIFKFNFGFTTYDINDDQLFYRVSYNYESKNIKKLKYFIEKSKRLQWWDDEDFSKYSNSRKTIGINYDPHKI